MANLWRCAQCIYVCTYISESTVYYYHSIGRLWSWTKALCRSATTSARFRKASVRAQPRSPRPGPRPPPLNPPHRSLSSPKFRLHAPNKGKGWDKDFFFDLAVGVERLGGVFGVGWVFRRLFSSADNEFSCHPRVARFDLSPRGPRTLTSAKCARRNGGESAAAKKKKK